MAVIGDRELVASLLAGALLEPAQILVTLPVRSADRTTASGCFALGAADAPRSTLAHHTLFALLAPYFGAALSARATLYPSAEHFPKKKTSAIKILL